MFIPCRHVLVSTGVTVAAGAVAGRATHEAARRARAGSLLPPRPLGRWRARSPRPPTPVGSGDRGRYGADPAEPGQFARSPRCAHAGCNVAEIVSGAAINCPCHGSSFN